MTVPRTPVTISRGMERGILILFMAAAAVVGLAFRLPPLRGLADLATGDTTLSLLAQADLPHSGSTDAGASIATATYETAWVTASGLSDGARWMIGLEIGFGAVTAAATVGAVVYFLLLLMWKRPFHRSLVVATQIAGCALLIGGILSGGLGGLGRMMTATELNPLADDVFIVGFTFDPGVLFAGIAVLALSFVFSYGAKLQRDTEGLV